MTTNTDTGLCMECDGTGITASPAYQYGGEIVDARESKCECQLQDNHEDYDN